MTGTEKFIPGAFAASWKRASPPTAMCNTIACAALDRKKEE